MMQLPIVGGPANGYRQRPSGKKRREAPTVESIHGETTRRHPLMPTLDTRRRKVMPRLPRSAVLKRARAPTVSTTWLGMYGSGWPTATTSIIISTARSTTHEGRPLGPCVRFVEERGIVLRLCSPPPIAMPMCRQHDAVMSGSAAPRMLRSSSCRATLSVTHADHGTAQNSIVSGAGGRPIHRKVLGISYTLPT